MQTAHVTSSANIFTFLRVQFLPWVITPLALQSPWMARFRAKDLSGCSWWLFLLVQSTTKHPWASSRCEERPVCFFTKISFFFFFAVWVLSGINKLWFYGSEFCRFYFLTPGCPRGVRERFLHKKYSNSEKLWMFCGLPQSKEAAVWNWGNPGPLWFALHQSVPKWTSVSCTEL